MKHPRRLRSAVLLLLAALCVSCKDSGTIQTPEAPRSSPGTPREGDARGCERSDFDLGNLPRFRPPVSRRDDRVVIPLTFVDGSFAELSLPREIDVVSDGMSIASTGSVGDFSRTLWIWHARLDQLLVAFGCPRLLHSYDRARGVVGLWHFPADPEVDYLAWPFGDWTVLVYDYNASSPASAATMTHRARAAWVENLRGRVTDDGFLVLGDRPPLKLAASTSRRPPTLTLFGDDGRVVLTSDACPPERHASPGSCLGGRVGVEPIGSRSFERDLLEGLSLESFTPAPG